MLYALIILSIVFWPLLAAVWAGAMVLDLLKDVRSVHEYARFLQELERALARNAGDR